MGVGTVYKLVLQQELFQQRVENALHFRSNILTDSHQHLAEAFDAFLSASWKNVQTTYLKYRAIRVYGTNAEDAEVFEMQPTQPAGQVSTTPVANQLAIIMAIRSNTTNRRRNGRVFLGGTPVAPVDGEGKIDLATRQTVETMVGALLTAFGGNPLTHNYTFGVYSRALPATETKPAREALFTAPSVIRISPTYGVQRRRRQGVGV